MIDRRVTSEYDEEHINELHQYLEDDHPDRPPLLGSRYNKIDMEEVRRVKLLDQQASLIGEQVRMTTVKNLLATLKGGGGADGDG